MRQDCKFYHGIIEEYVFEVDSYGNPIWDADLVGEICLKTEQTENCDECANFEKHKVRDIPMDELPF